MNQERNLEPCIRFWCRGSIAISAKLCIDKIISSSPHDAEAMIEEWVIKKYKNQMHKNKYQLRRGLRPSTSAASATQQELIQGPIQQPSPSQLSND